MFRAIRRIQASRNRSDERVGVIRAVNDNGTYRVDVGGVEYNAMPSAGIEYYRVGESVRIVFNDGRPIIVP